MNDIAARRNGRCPGLAERAVIAALHQGHPARWVVADRGDLLSPLAAQMTSGMAKSKPEVREALVAALRGRLADGDYCSG
jgi:ABC-type amino acid transport substrate-binding protein